MNQSQRKSKQQIVAVGKLFGQQKQTTTIQRQTKITLSSFGPLSFFFFFFFQTQTKPNQINVSDLISKHRF
jgi:hypothetical protein